MPDRKFAIVTGASTSSIGFLAAKELVEENFTVVLACRNDERGQEAVNAIDSEFAVYVNLDLASRKSIREFVRCMRELPEYPGHVNLLVNNAGVGWGPSTPYRTTEDGIEEVVGVNHFGTFYLSYLLADDLKRSTSPRVVTVSSSLHANKNDELLVPNFPDGILVSDSSDYDASNTYRVSKLANLWMTHEYPKKCGVPSYAVSPGWIPGTGLARQYGWLATFLLPLVQLFQYIGGSPVRSKADGAAVIVKASTQATMEGFYFRLNGQELESITGSPESQDPEKAQKLWELSLQTCQIVS